ncbi:MULTISPECIES: helix-turn-helix domain-containing protein [Pseudomonas]|uniref:Bacteriophage CI repressor n=1 Tax=Pseudomonas saxonica TaxID=2600598 RepID=A0A5C5Q1Y0_9PSED|nr:helix-turn-helix domain-containing protein [Pseudomonas saxonica]MCH4874076.1 phage repressor protein [Pseudomonas sp. TMW22091]TWR89945.1 bacteriophage CI repressor [Pseudomonas saxonica]TWR98287.1 bacteriophage CI repressor [Pseudomonas saxonica]WRQ75885.1 helix-turn-helix domain-containing protein [Pseudomonas saxonica]
MSNKKSIEILERLKKIIQVKTDVGLSEALGVSPQTLSSWKGRDSIPYSICIDLARERGVSLDWLLAGRGDMFLSLHSDPLSATHTLAAHEQKMLVMFRVLEASDQRNIYKLVEDKRHLQELTNRVEELSARLEILISHA